MAGVWLVLTLNILCLCFGKEDVRKDRSQPVKLHGVYLGRLTTRLLSTHPAFRFVNNCCEHIFIACHSTDYECFKRQYAALRQWVLLGNPRLGIDDYTPYYLRYGTTGTCIRISGFEDSVLTGISMNDGGHYYKLVLEIPFILQQLMFQKLGSCLLPEHNFPVMPRHTGPLKRFTGNATIQVTFPFYVKKKKGKMYMILGEEGVDVVLDILDLSAFRDGTQEDRERYRASEWAYDVVQHINVAERFALPFTGQIKEFTSKVPMDRYLILYPEEEFSTMFFKFSDTPYFDARDAPSLHSLVYG